MSTYYIDTGGNDSNNGTSPATPWKTIAKANTVGLVGGDSLFLKVGQIHSGNLLVDTVASATALAPIVIGSYGGSPGDRAEIDPSDSYGVKIRNTSYVTLQDIYVDGPGYSTSGSFPSKTTATTGTDPGIVLESTTTGTTYSHVTISNCKVDYCLFGIRLHNTQAAATAAYDDVTIQNCVVDNCLVAGIWVGGTGTGDGYIHTHTGMLYHRVTLQDCAITNILGLYTYTFGNSSASQTGFGIVIGNCNPATILRCYVYNCGEASLNTAGGGAAGIEAYESTNVTIRQCEVDTVRAPEAVDGCGIDFDSGCADSLCEQCYVRNCDGPGLLFFHGGAPFQTWQNCQYSVCIVENCGRHCASGGVRNASNVLTSSTLNCTFYHDGTVVGSVTALVAGPSRYVNNIFIIKGSGVTFGDFGTGFDAAQRLIGNCYYPFGGATFSMIVDGVTYGSLSSLNTDGYEKVSGVNVGVNANPQLRNIGGGSSQWPTLGTPTFMIAYDVLSSSPCKGVGQDPTSYECQTMLTGYHGTPMPRDTSLHAKPDTGRDIGACQFQYPSITNFGMRWTAFSRPS